uniref:type IV secretion system protein n=1 Tax=Parerythrobacter lutipelagi TaxID=1964208 RepID=UPI0010F5BCB5|nr:type IV secretion system protein [Parerythrobacter lutipelagi]
MACPTVITGDRFLSRTLEHLDCQAQVIGSYGYSALGQPGSVASIVVTGLLTLFVALYGLRFLFGPDPLGRDAIYDILKIGIVLTLAFSWPAFRTVIYDLVLYGPAQIAGFVSNAASLDGSGNLISRLQSADNTLVRLMEIGTGRNSGAALGAAGAGPVFAGTALQDDSAIGYARLAFLSSTVGSLALLRLLAGILLALAPIIAGLLLFQSSRGIFAGWLKGLVLCMAGSIGLTIVLGVELAIMEPWLADALRVRGLGYATPFAPLEILASALAFLAVKFGIIWLIAKVAFNRGLPVLPVWTKEVGVTQARAALVQNIQAAPAYSRSRVERMSDSVERLIVSEQNSSPRRVTERIGPDGAHTEPQIGSQTSASSTSPGAARLGSTWRRASRISDRVTGPRERGA